MGLDCLLDVRIGLLERNDLLQYMWNGPMQPDATTWRQQRNGTPDDPHAVDVIERTKTQLDAVVERLIRLRIRATSLGFAMWQFTKPHFDDPHADGQWAMARDHFDVMPDGGCKIRE